MRLSFSDKQQIKKITIWVAVLISGFYLLKQLAISWLDLRAADYDIDPLWFWPAVLLMAFALAANGLVWKILIGYVSPSNTLDAWSAVRITIWSAFGKYVPGKAWAIAGKIYFGSKKNIPLKHLAESTILQMVANNVAALLAGGAYTVLLTDKTYFYGYLLVFFILGVFLVFWERLNEPLNRFLIRISGNKAGLPTISRLKLFSSIALCAILHLAAGFAFLLLAHAVLAYPPALIPRLILAYTLANAAGMFVIFLPAGLGVRESLLVFLLGPYLTFPAAVIVSIVSRLWTVSADLLALSLTSIGRKKTTE